MAAGRVRIWNAPLRLFHWALATTFVLAWLLRTDQTLHLHLLAGYLFAGLLLFRLYWGFAGGRYARFRDFLHGPAAAWNYVLALFQGRAPRFLGHNPAGSWAVFAMLGLGLLIVATGILALGAEEKHGPVAGLFGFDAGLQLHDLHEKLAWSMLILVLLHLLGVLGESLWHRENLPLAMITGYKPVRAGEKGPDAASHGCLAWGMLLLMLLFSAGWLQGYFKQDEANPFLPFSGPDLARDPVWQEECGACHLAYSPGLLPAASWQTLLNRQDDHFGEDLALDKETVHHLQRHALNHSAERAETEAAWKILHSLNGQGTPLRITETPYWKSKHNELGDAVWQRPQVNGQGNCDACHLDAEQGWFEDSAIRIPGNPVPGTDKTLLFLSFP